MVFFSVVSFSDLRAESAFTYQKMSRIPVKLPPKMRTGAPLANARMTPTVPMPMPISAEPAMTGCNVSPAPCVPILSSTRPSFLKMPACLSEDRWLLRPGLHLPDRNLERVLGMRQGCAAQRDDERCGAENGFLCSCHDDPYRSFTPKRRARNSPPCRSPSWSMPWPMPCDRCHSTGMSSAARPLRGLEQRLRWNEIVAVAVHQQDRRARLDLGRKFFGVDLRRQYQHAGIADDRRGRRRAAQPDVKRHHGALAEADERERRRRQLVARELGIEELIEHRHRLVDAGPALVGMRAC